MSESTSVNTNLTSTSFFSSSPQEFYNWFSFNMKLVFFFIVIAVLLSLVFFPASMDYDIMYDNINNIKSWRGRRSCRHRMRCPYCNTMGCSGNCRAMHGMPDISAMNRAIILNRLIEIPLTTTSIDGKVPNNIEVEGEPKKMQMKKVESTQVPQVPQVPQGPQAPLVPAGIVPEIGKEIVMEKFSNEDMMSFSYEKSSEYQSIPLLSQMDENNNPKNLFFGQANRFIISKDGKLNYRLEIYCNLLVLNGNIYDTVQKVDHMYKVFLINTKTGEQIFLDVLKKDGDGMYKLKFNSLDIKKEAQEFVGYDKIQIIYSLDNKDDILLEGKFK
jgi:hypothetical protein